MQLRASLAILFLTLLSPLMAIEHCEQSAQRSIASRELADINSIGERIIPEIKCFSERMFSIQDKSDRFMAPAQVTTFSTGGARLLRFRSPPYGELIFNLEDGVSTWKTQEFSEAIVIEDEVIGIRRLKHSNAPQRGTIFNQLPSEMRRVFTALEKVGKETLREEISLCSIPEPTERDFRVKMLSEEVTQCKALISKVKGFVDCQDNNSCAEYYLSEFGDLKRGEAPEKMNHEHMYRVNQGLSKRKKVIGGLIALDYAVSYSVWGTLAFMAARGYKVVKAATAWGILSNSFSLIWPFVFDFENCKPEAQGGNIDDCRALSPKRMTSNFQAQLLDIIMKPDDFDPIAASEDGGLGRVVCLSMEALYLQEAARYKSLPEISCSKYTMEIGSRNYLIKSDGHLAHGRSGNQTLHYYLDGDFIVENPLTGESRNLTADDPKFNSFGSYSEYMLDYRELSLLRPRIEEALNSEECRKLPAHQDDFVRSR
jgi:hypothetical protein